MNHSLFFISFFTLPSTRKHGEVSFVKFLFLPSWFAKVLETNFSRFAKISWMPSLFVKLLKLLLESYLTLINLI
jgi:hypothetical protein